MKMHAYLDAKKAHKKIYTIILHGIAIPFVMFFLLLGGRAQAQSDPSAAQRIANLNRQVVPQPPNVASLLKFNEIPVEYFNGTADVGVPLFNVDENGLNISLGLNYHTGGIKVSEESSWIGLGWSLPVGGIIQEIISGNPDYNNDAKGFANDYSRAPKPWNSLTYVTGYNSPGSSNFIESGFCYVNSSGSVASYYDILHVADPDGSSNFEYDLYSFSFGNKSGKFVLLDDVDGTCLDRQNIKFTITNRNNVSTDTNYPSTIAPYNSGSTITATTPDGTKYFFGLVGFTYSPNPLRLQGANPLIPDIKSRTWYLTQIIYPDNRQVNFSYTKRTGRSLPTFDESSTVQQFNDASADVGNRTLSTQYSIVESFYLAEIIFPNGRIKFQTSDRVDVENGLKLDKIQLFDNDSYNSIPIGTPKKEINFLYDYFVGSYQSSADNWPSNFGLLPTQPSAGSVSWEPNADLKSKRLRLNEVRITDSQSHIGYIPYKFEYSQIPLPYKTSLSQDLWGFYNGALNRSLLPDYNKNGYWDSYLPSYFLALDPYSLNLGNRGANEIYVQTGSLTKITYPTGGYSMIETESNSFQSPGSSAQGSVYTTSQIASDNASNVYQQVEFDVPSIGYNMQIWDPTTLSNTMADANPTNIQINLHCCGDPDTRCDVLTSDYCNPNQVNSNMPTKGLYVRFEKLSGTQWLTNFDGGGLFTLASTNIDHAGNIVMNTGLRPGRYRIIANYPDNQYPAPGAIGPYVAQAKIMVSFKKMQTLTGPPIVKGGGLRVKSIKNYTASGTPATQKNFSYSPGVLMTLPKFYRKFSHENFANTNSASCSANEVSGAGNCPGACPTTDCNCQYIIDNNYSLNSTPVQSYSYSAKGALIGYGVVTVNYDTDGNRGRTVYTYNNLQDDYFHDAITLPGIPTSPNFLTGTLKNESHYVKNGTVPVKSIDYQYTLSGFDIRWCFKLEYMPVYRKLYTCLENPPCALIETGKGISRGPEPWSTVLHFYPLKFGKVNLTTKIETINDGASLISTTNYQYNNKQQLQNSTTKDSNGNVLSNETYYPSDYSNTTDITHTMRNRNMLDYPIENISRINGLATVATYTDYYLHDDMVSIQAISKLNTASPVSFNASVVGNIRDSKYEKEAAFMYGQQGTLQQQQLTDDVSTVYLWGYNNTYPVMEIKNATYDQVKAALGITGPSIDFGSGTFSKEQLNVLQSSLPNVQITTYVYSILEGLISVTDPNGKTTSYRYDSLQRLEAIYDNDGNILKTFHYNYKH